MLYILEAKLGMSDDFEIIGEYSSLQEAKKAQQIYEFNQISGDLYCDSNIVSVDDLA